MLEVCKIWVFHQNPIPYGSLLIPVTVNKLPVELQLVISRKLDKANWDVEKFMEEFKTELEARERDVT